MSTAATLHPTEVHFSLPKTYTGYSISGGPTRSSHNCVSSGCGQYGRPSRQPNFTHLGRDFTQGPRVSSQVPQLDAEALRSLVQEFLRARSASDARSGAQRPTEPSRSDKAPSIIVTARDSDKDRVWRNGDLVDRETQPDENEKSHVETCQTAAEILTKAATTKKNKGGPTTAKSKSTVGTNKRTRASTDANAGTKCTEQTDDRYTAKVKEPVYEWYVRKEERDRYTAKAEEPKYEKYGDFVKREERRYQDAEEESAAPTGIANRSEPVDRSDSSSGCSACTTIKDLKAELSAAYDHIDRISEGCRNWQKLYNTTLAEQAREKQRLESEIDTQRSSTNRYRDAHIQSQEENERLRKELGNAHDAVLDLKDDLEWWRRSNDAKSREIEMLRRESWVGEDGETTRGGQRTNRFPSR